MPSAAEIWVHPGGTRLSQAVSHNISRIIERLGKDSGEVCGHPGPRASAEAVPCPLGPSVLRSPALAGPYLPLLSHLCPLAPPPLHSLLCHSLFSFSLLPPHHPSVTLPSITTKHKNILLFGVFIKSSFMYSVFHF